MDHITQGGMYLVIPASVAEDVRLRERSKLIYGRIVQLASSTGFCYASNQALLEILSHEDPKTGEVSVITERTLQSVLAELRDRASSSQCRQLLKQAVSYIDSHFTEESLSLNQVAREVNISANYLSAVFSQEIGATFTEYVTGKRMDRAKELLRTTDKRSGEVAAAVGYKDPHYFSFLFKKTQGCTPRDYRGGKRS